MEPFFMSASGFFTSLFVYLGMPLIPVNIAAVLVLALGILLGYLGERNGAMTLILLGIFILLLSLFIYFGTPLLVINIICVLLFIAAFFM